MRTLTSNLITVFQNALLLYLFHCTDFPGGSIPRWQHRCCHASRQLCSD